MKTKKWRPRLDEWYYYIDIAMGKPEIMGTKYLYHSVDDDRLKINNYFKTRTEAIKKLKLIKTILKQP